MFWSAVPFDPADSDSSLPIDIHHDPKPSGCLIIQSMVDFFALATLVKYNAFDVIP